MRRVVFVVLGFGLGGCSLFLTESDSGTPQPGCAGVPSPDDDCDTGVCDRVSGECIEDALYVDPGGDDGDACTQQQPCASLARALEVATSNGNPVVHVAPSTYTDTFIEFGSP